MDVKSLWQNLAEEMVRAWEILPTGSGFVVASDWSWPTSERIEIVVRSVGDREDLYLVTDGGELFNFFFAQGLDITQMDNALHRLEDLFARHGVKIVDYQLARGANDHDLPQVIRSVLEAVKEAAFLFWLQRSEGRNLH
jgi:hypothetical protein